MIITGRKKVLDLYLNSTKWTKEQALKGFYFIFLHTYQQVVCNSGLAYVFLHKSYKDVQFNAIFILGKHNLKGVISIQFSMIHTLRTYHNLQL